MLGAGTALAGCDAVPSSSDTPHNLAAQESRFTLRVNAPDSRFAIAVAPEDSFRAREIPAELRERTLALLTDLKARESADTSIVIDLPADVLFDFDKADLRSDAMPALEKAAELLASYPTAPLAIYGHTDDKGEEAYNEPLSRRRAQAVADWLKTKSARSADVEGYGERKPVAPNANPDGSDDPEGRQKNRRVEIVIKPLKGGGARESSSADAPVASVGPTAGSKSSFGPVAKPQP